jgi:hypothetical protein
MDSIELKYNWPTRSFCVIFIGIAPLIGFIDNFRMMITNGKTYLTPMLVMTGVILLASACILLFSYFPNFKISITENGVEKHLLAKLGPFVLFKRNYIFSWDRIVTFEHVTEGVLYAFIAKGIYHDKEVIAALINFALTNRKKAIKEIANILPPEKVNANVWPYIKKWEAKGEV